MTFDEIKQTPELQIDVTPAVEDCFYFLKALDGELSDEAAQKALDRMWNDRVSKREMEDSMRKAQRMIDNLKKYGVPCAQWT